MKQAIILAAETIIIFGGTAALFVLGIVLGT